MGNRNVASDYSKKPSEKTAVINASDALLQETMRIMCRENVFPKRSRWQFAGPLADLVNNYHTCIALANGIIVTNHTLFAARYIAQTMAIAWLYALNVKMTAAQLCLEAPADRFDHWAELWNKADRTTKAWRNKDQKRYETQFGSLTADELREPTTFSPLFWAGFPQP